MIPICDTITYLGTKLTLKDGSDKTLEFRLAEAAAKVSSLRKSIRSRKGFSGHHRVRVWDACPWSACLPHVRLVLSTKKALRQHQALRHGQIQADRVHIDYKPEQHSISGMPQCRHCHLKLYNWPALKGHSTLNVCGWCQPQNSTQPEKGHSGSRDTQSGS